MSTRGTSLRPLLAQSALPPVRGSTSVERGVPLHRGLNSFAPPALAISHSLYPPLTRWANVWRTYGARAGVVAQSCLPQASFRTGCRSKGRPLHGPRRTERHKLKLCYGQGAQRRKAAATRRRKSWHDLSRPRARSQRYAKSRSKDRPLQKREERTAGCPSPGLGSGSWEVALAQVKGEAARLRRSRCSA